jgi:hypothetical protein
MAAVFRQISISILLTACAASVHAVPGHDRGGFDRGASANRGNFADREIKTNRGMEADPDRRFGGGAWEGRTPAEGRPESRDAPEQVEQGRRSGRMSPEERRALRQQINEASHDLYLQKP